MLIIELTNISRDDANKVADYTARVYINRKLIWSGMVYQHKRSLGWRGLLRKLVRDGVKSMCIFDNAKFSIGDKVKTTRGIGTIVKRFMAYPFITYNYEVSFHGDKRTYEEWWLKKVDTRWRK